MSQNQKVMGGGGVGNNKNQWKGGINATGSSHPSPSNGKPYIPPPPPSPAISLWGGSPGSRRQVHPLPAPPVPSNIHSSNSSNTSQATSNHADSNGTPIPTPPPPSASPSQPLDPRRRGGVQTLASREESNSFGPQRHNPHRSRNSAAPYQRKDPSPHNFHHHGGHPHSSQTLPPNPSSYYHSNHPPPPPQSGHPSQTNFPLPPPPPANQQPSYPPPSHSAHANHFQPPPLHIQQPSSHPHFHPQPGHQYSFSSQSNPSPNMHPPPMAPHYQNGAPYPNDQYGGHPPAYPVAVPAPPAPGYNNQHLQPHPSGSGYIDPYYHPLHQQQAPYPQNPYYQNHQNVPMSSTGIIPRPLSMELGTGGGDFCLRCGLIGHKWSTCNTDGNNTAGYALLARTKRQLVSDWGNRLCAYWNGQGGKCYRSGKCEFDHICSLCFEPHHQAPDCRTTHLNKVPFVSAKVVNPYAVSVDSYGPEALVGTDFELCLRCGKFSSHKGGWANCKEEGHNTAGYYLWPSTSCQLISPRNQMICPACRLLHVCSLCYKDKHIAPDCRKAYGLAPL